ncbi:MAG: MarR family transcriptional regulator [Chloroflexota bacterium]
MSQQDAIQNTYATNRQTATQIWLRMIRVAQKISQAAEAPLDAMDLTAPQFDLLAQLVQTEGIMQQELAEKMHVTKGNISQLLTKLEEKQLILRQKEGRTVYAYLTPAGRKLIEAELVNYDHFVASRFTALSSEEQRDLLKLLHKLDRSL